MKINFKKYSINVSPNHTIYQQQPHTSRITRMQMYRQSIKIVLI